MKDSPVNQELHETDYWKEDNPACKRCGRRYPDTVLNIEGHIHHGAPLECLDRKACKKAKRHFDHINQRLKQSREAERR